MAIGSSGSGAVPKPLKPVDAPQAMGRRNLLKKTLRPGRVATAQRPAPVPLAFPPPESCSPGRTAPAPPGFPPPAHMRPDASDAKPTTSDKQRRWWQSKHKRKKAKRWEKPKANGGDAERWEKPKAKAKAKARSARGAGKREGAGKQREGARKGEGKNEKRKRRHDDVARSPPRTSPRKARSLSPPGRRGRAEPDLQLLVGGRGARELELVKLFEGKPTLMHCPKGCALEVSARGSIRNRARLGEDIQLFVASAKHDDLNTTFVVRQGLPVAEQCPSCKQRCIEIKTAEMGAPITKARRVERSTTVEAITDAAPENVCETQNTRRFAFSSAIWASDDRDSGIELAKYIADAIHVGNQLRLAMRENPRVDAEVDRVLLAAGVKKSARTGSGYPLLKLLWKVRDVQHVQVDVSLLGTCQQRFAKVFTKIRHWDLDEYELVAALDLDLLVKPGVTDLLGCRPPAAFFRGNSDNIFGDRRPANTLFHPRSGKPQGGINAGVMVLRPSKSEFRTMEKFLQTQDHPRQINDSNAPEQDFLSMHFGSSWTALPVKFNWQPHQLRYLFDGRSTRSEDGGSDRMNVDYEKIEIIHFSAKEKPRDFLFEQVTGGRRRGKEEFKEFLIQSYLKQEYTKVTIEGRSKIARSIEEWFQAWDVAWIYVLQTVAACKVGGSGVDKCPMCGSQKLGVSDPMHCFFFCESKDIEGLRGKWEKRHYEAMRQPVPSDAMATLKDAATYPWSVEFVEGVYKLRETRRSQKALTPVGAHIRARTATKPIGSHIGAPADAPPVGSYALVPYISEKETEALLKQIAELAAGLPKTSSPEVAVAMSEAQPKTAEWQKRWGEQKEQRNYWAPQTSAASSESWQVQTWKKTIGKWTTRKAGRQTLRLAGRRTARIAGRRLARMERFARASVLLLQLLLWCPPRRVRSRRQAGIAGKRRRRRRAQIAGRKSGWRSRLQSLQCQRRGLTLSGKSYCRKQSRMSLKLTGKKRSLKWMS